MAREVPTAQGAHRSPSTETTYKFGSMEGSMQVSEAMSTDVKIASSSQSIRDAARTMAEIDAGILPVGENDRLVGMITDRDIAIRAVAVGRDPSTPVREVMSREVKYCFDDDDLAQGPKHAGDALCGISEPGGAHSQTGSGGSTPSAIL
jgi:CBS-domain-containing membrane protein